MDQNVHCIGDRANKVVLDIFEEIIEGENVTDWRPRIEHAQIMQMSDLERAGRLGGSHLCSILRVSKTDEV
jgi:predicted amidohydrolase YtcJ